MLIFVSFLLAVFATMVMIPPLIGLAFRLGFVDHPNHRKVHTQTITRIGGLAFFLGAVLPVLIWGGLDRETLAVLLGGGIIVVFGLVDDRLELGFKTKLVGQVVGSIAVIAGGIQIETMPGFMGGADLPVFVSIPLTLFMIVSVTNAVNFSDGLDGLAGGVVLASLVAIAVMAFEIEHQAIALISICLIGSLLGFLQFNSHPARLFMGDAGSQFLGFSLAVLTIWLTQGEFSVYAVSIPLLLIGLPLIDIVMVTLNRKLDGKSAFVPDKTHFHHRMLALGLDHMEAVLVIYLFQIGVVFAGFMLRFSSNAVVIGVFSGLLLLYFVVFRNTDRIRARFRPERLIIGNSRFAQRMTYLRKEGGFSQLSVILTYAAIALLYIYAMVVAKSLLPLAPGISLLALFLAIASARLYVKNAFTEWFERIAYYIAAMMVVFLMPIEVVSSQAVFVFFLLLATIVFVGMHYTWDARVKAKPMDVLILLLVLALPKVLGSMGADESYAFSAFYLVVLFYAIEMLLLTSTYFCGQQRYLKLILMMPLLLIGVRSILGV